jgi:acetylornithine/succinyldiaminopimelate/putrescine aminotransferase
VNSPSRGAAVYTPSPIVLERGLGSHVWDADGNEYIDFMMSFGALIQGHAHPTLSTLVLKVDGLISQRANADCFRLPRSFILPTYRTRSPVIT